MYPQSVTTESSFAAGEHVSTEQPLGSPLPINRSNQGASFIRSFGIGLAPRKMQWLLSPCGTTHQVLSIVTDPVQLSSS